MRDNVGMNSVKEVAASAAASTHVAALGTREGVPALQASPAALSVPAPLSVSAPWRDRLTLLLESTGDGIFGIDMDGCCIFMNRAASELLGYALEDALGRNMHALVHHAHRDGSAYHEHDCPIFRAFRVGLPCRVDTEVFWRADGEAFEVEYSSHPILENGAVVGAVITFLDITERRRAEAELIRARQELEARVAERTAELSAALVDLRELSAHAHSVREEERTRIAREIHDELGSLLVALKYDVSWLARRVDGDAQRNKCGAMAGLIEGAVENVGRIITDLRPSILDHQGLLAALDWQLNEFRTTTEIEVAASIHAARGAVDPSGALATAIFRIFQEMLSNVARHAKATRVQVAIALEDGVMSVAVHDNGQGARQVVFEVGGSYGVMGMRERARHFGGRLSITSHPLSGTRVALVMPLPDVGAA
jgi:PAS domain S-box-containing protein